MIYVEIADGEVLAALRRIQERLGDAGLRPAMALAGEHLAETSKRRFESSTAPDGRRWAPNARSTLEGLLAGTRGGTTKNGRISARGSAAVAGKRPLVDTGELAHTIRWQHIAGGVAVGTDRFASLFDGGAAVHQFGRRDGHIPARPFLGLSPDDRTALLRIVEEHLGAV